MTKKATPNTDVQGQNSESGMQAFAPDWGISAMNCIEAERRKQLVEERLEKQSSFHLEERTKLESERNAFLWVRGDLLDKHRELERQILVASDRIDELDVMIEHEEASMRGCQWEATGLNGEVIP